MIQIDIFCRDYTGKAAEVVESFGEINIAGHDFRVERWWLFWEKGHLTLFFRDLDANKAKFALKNDKSLWGLRVLYCVKVRLEAKPGTLKEILKKLKRENIKLQKSLGPYPEVNPQSGMHVVLLKLNCTDADYAFAKKMFEGRIVDEDSMVPDSFFESFTAFKDY